MQKKIINIVLGVLILSKLALSFIQQARISLDGDLASIVVPSESYKKVMKDPLGLNVLLHNEKYAAPNRSFAHWTMYGYFRSVPFFMQNFTNKIDSIYASVAFAKMLIEAFIIYMLASIAGNTRKFYTRSFLFPAIFIAILFQTSEFNQYIGIIDRSITYAFFYALPLSVLLYFFHSIYFIEKSGGWENASPFRKIVLFILPVYITLSGPLNTGVSVIACPLFILQLVYINRRSITGENVNEKIKSLLKIIPKSVQILFPVLFLLSLYSLYIGRNNSENFNALLTVTERYNRMAGVLPEFFTGNPALPALILFILLNFFLFRYATVSPDQSRIFRTGKFVLLFSLIYLFLLPLGGYRIYRPTILRVDTFVPVLICLLYLAGASSFILYQHLRSTGQNIFLSWLIIFSAYFIVSDTSLYKDNKYERLRLRDLSVSTEKMTELQNDCTVMAWVRMTNYRESELNCKLLRYWGVIDKPEYYFQK